MNNEQDEEEFVDGQSPLGLGAMSVISERAVSEGQSRIYRMLADVKAEIAKRGIHDAPRPANHPRALADMDMNLLTNDELANLYTQYVAYASYIGDELSEVECLELAAKKLLKETLGELKDAEYVKGLKGGEATNAAIKNPLYKELDLEHTTLFFMLSIMKRKYTHYVKQAAALSRNVEVRKLDFENQRRDNNLRRGGQIKQPAPTGFGPKQMGPKRSPSSG